MSRVQLALNVSDIDEAVAYVKTGDTEQMANEVVTSGGPACCG